MMKTTLWGESHGSHVGVVIDGFPMGLSINWNQVHFELGRRRPGTSAHSTARQEQDLPEVLSGVYRGATTGAPILCKFINAQTRGQDYEKQKTQMRPGHADYTAELRYGGWQDVKGGGHFSGRLTVGLVLAGALAKQWLTLRGILVEGRITQIGTVCRDVDSWNNLLEEDYYFPMPGEASRKRAKDLIETAKASGDSVGGIAEVRISGVPGGVGSPMFDGFESRLSEVIFGIPGVKGLLFGSGMAFAEGLGSELNDAFTFVDDRVMTLTNHNGGINGGIANGMPIQFSVVVKPTPSIAKIQRTVEKSIDIDGRLHWHNCETQVIGRHDPCIVPRAVPVFEAAAALVVMDLILESEGYNNVR